MFPSLPTQDGVIIGWKRTDHDRNESSAARASHTAPAWFQGFSCCDASLRHEDRFFSEAGLVLRNMVCHSICGKTSGISLQVRNSTTGETEIKRICDVASSHIARRTFVGAAYKVVKDPNIVGKMSGHVEGSRAFNRFRQIDDDILRETINEI